MGSIEQRLSALEQENAQLRKRVTRQNWAWLFSALLLVGGGAVAGGAIKEATFDRITAKEILIVDNKGVLRTRVAGSMPDAVNADGKVLKRGSNAAGVMLYDEQGLERGGYVTQDEGSNVMLTLDTKYRQAALFVAGPERDDAGAALQLWTKTGGIELRSDNNGQRMSVTDKTGVTYQQPAIAALTPETCKGYREYAKKEPGARWCEKRFAEATCKACLQAE